MSAVQCEGHEFPVEMTISEARYSGQKAAESDSLGGDLRLARDEGLPRRALSLGEPVWLQDYSADDRFPRARAARQAGLDAAIAVPVLRKQDIVGVLEFFTAELRVRDRSVTAAPGRRPCSASSPMLTEAARAWQGQLRASDVLARYGGEEFAAVIPAWPRQTAISVVERLRRATPAGLTASAGLASWDRKETAAELFGRADAALYEAKQRGRNRTVATD
jgi:hypothetical protein